MPPFVIAILGSIAGGLGTDAARRGLDIARRRVRLNLAGRVDPRPPRQVAPPREVITPPLSRAPVGGQAFEYPLTGPGMAHRLTELRRPR